MKRRRATWCVDSKWRYVYRKKTLSGAQMHGANEDEKATIEAAYRANPLLHWPEEETYNLAVETGNWSEYDARYGNDDDSLMLDEQFFYFYDDDEVEDL